MNVKVNVENKELVLSSVVHVQENQEVGIEIEGLKLKFNFIKDDENTSSSYRGVVEDGVFLMSLKNFNNVLGEGVLKPIELGHINNRRLYLTFYVYTYQNQNRRFEYNLFLGENV